MSDTSGTAAHRRGLLRSCRVALVVLVAGVGGACSSGGSTTSSSSTPVTLAPAAPSSGAPSATVPAMVDPGTGVLVLGADSVRFGVTACALTPAVDANGITTSIAITGTDASGGVVSVTRQATAGPQAVATTTDTVSYATSGQQRVAQRFESGGAVHDLRDTTATVPLIAVDGSTVRADAVFGPPGATAADPALVHGALVVTCP